MSEEISEFLESSVELHFHYRTVLAPEFEEENFVFIHCEMVYDNGFQDEEQIGKAQLIMFDLESMWDNHESIISNLDESAITYQYESIFDEELNDYKEQVYSEFLDMLGYSNLLVLDRIEILPKFRGRGITEMLIKRFSKVHGRNCELIGLIAQPLQLENQSDDAAWNQKMEFHRFEKSEKLAKDNLVNFYERMGFRQIPQSDMMLKFIDG